MKTVDELSVFFPAYNEEGNIASTVKKSLDVLSKLQLKNYEVLVIDDGSTDQTRKIVEEITAKDKHVRLITHTPNRGYGEAVKSGLYNARYPWIAFTDADGQFDFSEVTKLLEKADQAPVVIGYRMNRQDPWQRKLFGWGWTALTNTLLGIRVRDIDCAFKLIRKDVIENILSLQSTRGAMISPELIAKIRKKGYKVVEVGVSHYPRTAGKQTGSNLKVVFKSFIDLTKLWWQIK